MSEEINIVLLGANGQLGRTIQMRWPQANPETPVNIFAFSHTDLDISDEVVLEQQITPLKPRWIINAAAYTAVDKAEEEPIRATAVNDEGADNIARLASRLDCRLLHISTDYVFRGNACQPYRPEDPPSPLSVYGASKLAGERAVQDNLGHQAIILRTGWLYSPYRSNFLLTMLKLMGDRAQLTVVDDQVGTPTASHSLADLLMAMVQQDSAGGIYHWSDAGVASWYDFAVAIQEEALALGLLTKAIPLRPIPGREYPTAARRPHYSVLDKSATVAAVKLEPVHWRVRLREVLGEIQVNGYYRQ
ncbi:MAG: hypothetical protein RLZZ385_254 [Pseudomonadota bacterium]|jgi:dTDP-4-dehydrorhamnose reductase